MAKNNLSSVVYNPWSLLNKYTDARIGLGRTGVSIPTDKLLAFQLAHAQAQDAVHLPLDVQYLTNEFNNMSIAMSLMGDSDDSDLLQKGCPLLRLYSQSTDRNRYLQRPDLGRRLDKPSAELLHNTTNHKAYDLAIVIVDGLSSLAIKKHAINYIKALTKSLAQDSQTWKLAPFTVVQQGRVAVGDEVGGLLKAKAVLVLIGERPGLSSPDSLGLYLSYSPKIGLNDSNRNCISNVRSEGLSYKQAAKKSLYLLKESRRLKFSGVNLKDRVNDFKIENQLSEKNFLTQ